MTSANVVGITFCEIKNHPDIWNQIHSGSELMMTLEPTNPRDPNAVKITGDGVHIGYIERTAALELTQRMKQHEITQRTCHVIGKNGTPTNRPVLVVEY